MALTDLEKVFIDLKELYKSIKIQAGPDSPEALELHAQLKTARNRYFVARSKSERKELDKETVEILLQPKNTKFTRSITTASGLKKAVLIRHMIEYAEHHSEGFISYLNEQLGRDQKINIQLDMELNQ